MTSTTTARIVGSLMLTATVTYMLGSGLLASILNAPEYLLHVYPTSARLVLGVLLQFVDAAAVAAIGIILFPILRKHSQSIALGYAGTRIIECLLLLVAGISSLLLIALSQAYVQAGAPDASYFQSLGTVLVAHSELTFQVAMIALGLGSMPFCYLLYRSRLIPRAMSVLGFIGYAALFLGGLLELFGLNLHMLQYLPGGIFELILPIWLIAKGFNASAIVAESAEGAMVAPQATVVARRGGTLAGRPTNS